MSCRITTTKAADQDIRDIAAYIAANDPNAARKFGIELWRTFGLIADSPRAGRAVPGFGAPLRVVRVPRAFVGI
jgi:plasmid stabilization system protein ParE